MVVQTPLGVEGVGVVPGAVLHGIGAGVAGGVGVRGVVHRDTADDVLPLLGGSAGEGQGQVRSVRSDTPNQQFGMGCGQSPSPCPEAVGGGRVGERADVTSALHNPSGQTGGPRAT